MDKRLVLKNVYVAPTGSEATVELAVDDREVTGHASWGTTTKDQLSVVADATLKAIAQFLHSEVGLTVGKIMKAPDVLYVRVDLRTPQESHQLWGIAPLTDDPPGTVAKAILSAVNRRSSLVFTEPSTARASAAPSVGVTTEPPLRPREPAETEPATSATEAAATPPQAETAVASGAGQVSEWRESSIQEQLAARGLTLDPEGNIVPLSVPEMPAPSPLASPSRQTSTGIPETYPQRFSNAEQPEELVRSEATGGGRVVGRPSLTGVDGERLWRLVEALIEKHRQEIIEEVTLAQAELRVLEWIVGLPRREEGAIQTLLDGTVKESGAQAPRRKR